MDFHPNAFKGHTVFVWKNSSDYSFVWLADRNSLIPREAIANAQQISKCIVIERMKKMKGFKQQMRLSFIEDPRSQSFTNLEHNPGVAKDDFLDLLEKIEILAKENQIDLLISDHRIFKPGTKGL